jgi:cation diffusion facilitator CzcD-associated flavoprotein CzcO
LPTTLVAHTGHRIDFAALAGKSVAVLGAGASALDAAGTALEAGAAQVHLFVRRDDLIVQGPGGFPPGSLGARENFHRRTDADPLEAQGRRRPQRTQLHSRVGAAGRRIPRLPHSPRVAVAGRSGAR